MQVNAIAFREGDAWVAQGLEYDIVAQAPELENLPSAFTRAVLENVCITRHLGRAPLEGIEPAPQHFFEMFARAKIEVRLTEKSNSVADVALRVAA